LRKKAPVKTGSHRVPLTPETTEWRRRLLPVGALWLCALAAYSNSFRTGLPFDNDWVIQQDSRIQAATSENLRLIFTEDYSYKNSSSGLYRPLTTLSYLVNYAVLGNGSNPPAYHWVNFALHAINMTLVYWLGLLLFRELTGGPLAALALAALWGLHPLLTESITNIVGRADLLAGFGIVAGLHFHIRSTDSSGPGRARWIALFVLATTVGMFSKENAIAVLGVMVAYDVIFRAGSRPVAELWRRCRLTYLALIVPFGIYFLLRASALGKTVIPAIPFTDNQLVGSSFFASRLTAVKVLGKYLWLMLWPANLSCDYSFNQIPLSSIGDWKAWLALAVCAGLAGLALFFYRRQRTISFFIALFFITIAPTANLVLLIGPTMAERFMYVPALGIAGCLVWLVRSGSQRIGIPFAAVMALLCVACGARTFVRNWDWQDERTLWTSAAKTAPSSYKVQVHLASALVQPSGEGLEQAVGAIDRALAILAPVPDRLNVPQAYSVAGFFYRSQGDALAAKNSSPQSQSWYDKSLDALLHGERVDRAIAREVRSENEARGIQTAASGWYPLYLELGETYLRLSNVPQALSAFEYGRAINPIPEFFEDMSRAYLSNRDTERAEITLLEGVLAGADSSKLVSELAAVYREREPQSCAVRDQNGTTSLNTGCPEVHRQVCAAARNLAALYRRMPQMALAQAIEARAVREFACGDAGAR
jgi:tetratricopeptide (TPR) repeat protein